MFLAVLKAPKIVFTAKLGSQAGTEAVPQHRPHWHKVIGQAIFWGSEVNIREAVVVALTYYPY